MFLSYGVPANSDYYPYLDLHAAKYRFCAGRPKSSPPCSRTAYRSSLCSKG